MAEKSILADQRLQASLRRLKAMGLKFYTSVIDNDSVVITFDMDSVAEYLRRAVESRITFPNKLVVYDKETNVLAIFISRSAKKLDELYVKAMARLAPSIGSEHSEGGGRE